MRTEEAIDRATAIAKRIASGALEPYEGATMIWKQILVHLEHIPDELWPFKSCASAIEDCLWNAQESSSCHDVLIADQKREIMQAATTLVGPSRTQSS